ncbi:uncharacterized protein [Apostichopus japonicus]|uniref:uncharacterized protein isoform X2 n=1 Tax=Stichopus japonicus TaxID=307972 RepID=UPI003AB66CAF
MRLLVLITVIFSATVRDSWSGCTSPQHATIGKSWEMMCRLKDDWMDVAYYRGPASDGDMVINSHKVNGHNDTTDGNLWVTEFGALVINNVTRDDISVYTLQYIDSKGQQYLHTFIVIDCPSTVYIQHGSDGLIKCYFPQSQRIFWYDSTSRNARPIISLEEGQTSGSGYSDGKYDILNNGGLLIRNTTFNDQRTYRVIVIVSNISTFTVDQRVVIYANTQTAVLSINVCGVDSFCLVKKTSTPLVCRESKTGPNTLLTWTRVTSGGTQLAEATRYASFDGSLYETYISTNVTFNLKHRVIVYICTSTINIPSKPVRQIVVMVEDEDKDFATSALLPTYYREYDDVKLLCTNENPIYFVWKRKVNVTNYETIGYYYGSKSGEVKPGYKIGEDGSLLIKSLTYPQEGEYVCIFNTGTGDEYKPHRVKCVSTPPNPAPGIIGCSNTSNCKFNVTTGGYLTCLIEGVRPIVHPKLIEVDHTLSVVTFRQPQLIVRSVGSLFNIYVTSYYSVNPDKDWQSSDIKVACIITYETLGQFKTVVTLHLPNKTDNKEKGLTKHIPLTDNTDTAESSADFWNILIFTSIVVSIVITIVVKAFSFRNKQQRDKARVP